MWPLATVSQPVMTIRIKTQLMTRNLSRFWSYGSHQCILQERAQVLVPLSDLKGFWSALVVPFILTCILCAMLISAHVGSLIV